MRLTLRGPRPRAALRVALALVGVLASLGCAGGSTGTGLTAVASASPGAVASSAATAAAGPITVRVTFANAQTGATGTCPAGATGQKVTGAGTWTLTPRAAGEFDVVAEYESGARASGRLTVASHEAKLSEEGAAPGWAKRESVGTHRLNNAFDKATGTAQTTLTAANGTQCVTTWDLTTTFAKPLVSAPQ